MKKIILTCFLMMFSLFTFSQVEDSKGDIQFLAGYNNDIYTQPYSRNFNVFYTGIGYKTENYALYGKINYGFLIDPNSDGLQLEIDYYQRIAKTWTSWWNYAYSGSPNFPTGRVMGRVWKELPKGFLVSGGFRYYYFDENLFSLNAGLEKYMGRFWVEGMAHIYFKDPDPRMSYQLNSRVFWKDKNYVQLSLITGAAQDEPWITGNASTLNAHTVILGISTYTGGKQKLQLRANVGYSYEEYIEDSWRRRYTAGVGIIYTF